MDVGQAGFHNSKMVRTVKVEKRINEIVNRLNRTKVERKPDLKAERETVNAAERAERKNQLRKKSSLQNVASSDSTDVVNDDRMLLHVEVWLICPVFSFIAYF